MSEKHLLADTLLTTQVPHLDKGDGVNAQVTGGQGIRRLGSRAFPQNQYFSLPHPPAPPITQLPFFCDSEINTLTGQNQEKIPSNQLYLVL